MKAEVYKAQLIEVPTESVEQQRLFEWARMVEGTIPELWMLHHIANEGKRTLATGGRLRAEGLKRGVPDICLPVARGDYHGLYIELKRIRGGALAAEQLKWLVALRRAGYCAVWCKGWESAKNAICQYLRSGCVPCAESAKNAKGAEYMAIGE